jgi:hypothetical protein
MLAATAAAYEAYPGMNIIQNITPAGRRLRVIGSASGSNPQAPHKAP